MIRFALCLAVLCSATFASAEVETSGQLEPPKPFTLMLIRPASQSTKYMQPAPIDQWLQQPQTPEMARWRSMVDVREYSPGDEFMQEHHQYILSRMQSVPAIALVDDRGGCWTVLSGASFPRSELDLARSLETTYAAIMQAAKQVNQAGPAYQSMDRNQFQQAKQSYVRGGRGPEPWRPGGGGGGGGLFNPNLDFSGGFEASINSGVDQGTRRDAIILVLCICMTALLCMYMYGRAITDRDDE